MKRVFDESIELKDNAMLKRRPKLFYEWDFKRSGELGLDIYKITQGSGKTVWWNCPDCESVYDMKIYRRTKKDSPQNCPYCSGQRVNHTNSLASLRPDIAKEWHPTKNGDVTAHDVTCGSNKTFYWQGKCGHEWDDTTEKRTNGSKCPYCLNRRVLKGFNDVWTSNPDLAKLLANPNDGYKHTQMSNVKVDWTCFECENPIRNKMINTVNRQGLSCPKCSDGLPFGEKIIYNLLKEIGISFDYDKTQEWSQDMRHDFHFKYMDELYIIEVHGIQHFEESRRGRTLAEEQENDRLKARLAKGNNIKNYIVIDARESTVEWIKSSVLKSDIIKIARDINFEELGRLASKSFIKEACDLWMTVTQNISEIAKILKLSRNTILSYLKRGVEVGWCDYCPKLAKRLSATTNSKSRAKAVIQLSKDLQFIKSWGSALAAEEGVGIGRSGIWSVCTGVNKTAGGFKWMYKEDYDKLSN